MIKTHNLKVRDFIPLVGIWIYEARNDGLVEECDELFVLDPGALEKKAEYARIYKDSKMLNSIERVRKFENRDAILDLYNKLLLTSLVVYGTYKIIESLVN